MPRGRKISSRANWPAVDDSHQLAEHDVAHIAIAEVSARRVDRRQVPDTFPCLGRSVGVVFHRIVGDEAPAVQQQLFDCDLLLAAGSKRRDVLFDRVG